MEKTEIILTTLREKLLVLHKTLVDAERNDYQRSHGQIVQSVDFLNLLIKDPEYAWLRKISELIVWIDEIQDPKEMTAEIEPQNLIQQAKKLLNPAELGMDFEKKYQDALQRNADVILAHNEVRKILLSAD